MTMRKLVGVHVAGQWANKIEILRQWQPPLIVVLSPEVDKVRQLRMACPESVIVGRFFHDDSYYSDNISSRPEDFANEIHQEIIANPATPLLDYVQSNNEVCQSWHEIQRLNEFTQEWMHLADQSQAYKCAILAFSVGNPDMPFKPGDPAGFDGRMLYWQQVLPSLNYAQANNHILLLHAYGYPDMFHPNADWYIYRYERQVQANLRALGITHLRYAYGEIGIDRLIVNGKGGYKVITNDQDYTNQLLQWERDLQSQDLLLGGAIFTFGDSGGWDTYDITSTNVASMIATHYADHAGDYDPAGAVDDGGHTVFIPMAGTGQPAQSTLPERQIDPRLIARGVTIETPTVAPGQQFWHIVKAQWWNEQESQGRHHIYIETNDPDGRPQANVPCMAKGQGSQTPGLTNGKSGFDAANVPMWASEGKNGYGVWINGIGPSETLKGVGMGADEPGGFNAGVHTSTGVIFQWTTMPATTTPTQPTPEPKPQPIDMWIVTKTAANIRKHPSLDAAVLKVVPQGARLKAIGDAGEWYQAVGGGADAWMMSEIFYVHKSVVEPLPVPNPTEPTPSADNWSRAWPIVLKIEGGLSLDPNDTGNWYNGKLIGTKYGISAAVWGGQYDIPNLTKEQALSIYKTAYWDAANCEALPWPMCLIVFDTAINHGVGVANKLLAHKPTQEEIYLGLRLLRYVEDPKWRHFGVAWGNRVEMLDDIVDGEVPA